MTDVGKQDMHVSFKADKIIVTWRRVKIIEKHEDDAFAALPKIIDAITAASGIDALNATLTFECNPESALECSLRDKNSKPDCIGRVTALGSDLPYGKRKWIEVAVPGEFKKKDTDSNFQDVSHYK